LIEYFKFTKYKLCCTATPSPNDHSEIGNHAEFLNIMKRTEMLSMYFVHDAAKTQEWRLKGHAKKDFWRWVSSWATIISKPSNIGFNDNGFILPKLNLIEYEIKTENRGISLFNNIAVSATDFNAELRLTMKQRAEKVRDIIGQYPDENFIIWVKQNSEADYVKKIIPNIVEVRGDEKSEIKEKKLLGFANNEFKILLTKTKIAQFGLNFQNCHNQIFMSLDFSFESFYQAVRRSYRFMQESDVNIHIIVTDTMQNVIKAISEKQKKFEEMQKEMITGINYEIKYNNMKTVKTEITDNFTMINGDCIDAIKSISDKSVDLIIFSPPFAELYVYSNNIEDMGNSKDHNEFIKHFGFLIPELKRIIKHGRIIAVHCADLPILKGKEGFIGLRDFSNIIRTEFEKNNFIYHSRVTIWKDPVIEMQRTKALGLLHKQLLKDSIMSRVGNPDYVLLFRNEGINETPVKQNMSVDLWQKWASPVWMDINQTNTLSKIESRDENDEKHICPLQLDVIQRIIALYSNENETIFTPFAGIGSEVYQAIKMNRKGIGIELKESYFNQAVKNCKEAEMEKNQMTLFDFIKV